MALVRFSCTKAEAAQMLAYVNERERVGWFYAPFKAFERRHASIKAMLERALVDTSAPKSGPQE